MPKQGAVEKAIERLEAERAVIDLAIQKLRDQQQATVRTRKLRAVKPKPPTQAQEA